jgi:hypothetical protein
MHDLFISHSHTDKLIARRIARRLRAYSVKPWLDERELRLGNTLSVAIEKHIEASKIVLVIASTAAARSTWVSHELAFARNLQTPKPIYPFFVEHVETHPLFEDHLGLDATDPHRVEDAIIKLAEAIVGIPLPPLSAECMRTDLEDDAKQEPPLSLLLHACLDGQGLSATHMETVAQLPFHVLDYALNTLYDMVDAFEKEHIAFHAAHLFRRKGAGTYALERYAREQGRSSTVLSVAIGVRLNDSELDAALRVLSLCTPPDDQSLAGFIAKNGHSLTDTQRAEVVRQVTHPERVPSGFTIDAAFAALQHIPASEDLKALWCRWIRQGSFDGESEGQSTPRTLAWCLSEAYRLDLKGWEEIIGVFLSHVRRLARATDRQKVEVALDHMMAAASHRSPLLEQVCHECSAATGSAEWDNWSSAEEMSIYIDCFVQAARTDHNWLRALNEYRQQWKTIQEFNDELRHSETD